MTINERVSPKRLAEIIARAEVCDDSVLTDYRDIESIARELQQYRAATACPAVWVRYGDANHAPDCTLDNDEAREWVARGLDVVRMVSPINAAPQVTSVPDDYFTSLVSAARARADKAMRKFPQPNYVLNKVAEENGEVIKAVIHYTEGRETWINVEGEIIDNLAMLIRLVQEGDQVIGFTPPDACRAAMLTAAPAVQAEQQEPVSQPYTLREGLAAIRNLGPIDAEKIQAERDSLNEPDVPDGYALVPIRLTAENGAKGLLSGEFSETKFISCPECFGDDECETCDGSGRIEITVPVSWTTIKEIWAKGVEHFAAAPQQEANNG